jgi:hypothetical protein
MVFVINSSSVSWNQHGRSLALKALFFTLGGITAAALAGGALGLIGSSIPAHARRDMAVALALVGAFIVVAAAAGRHLSLAQRDCEVPRTWMYSGPLRSMVRFGGSMGLGFPSRIGFWAWYVVPAGALLGGGITFGAVTYGLYGLARTGAAPTLLLVARNAKQPLDEILPKRRGAARSADFVAVAAVLGAVLGAYL